MRIPETQICFLQGAEELIDADSRAAKAFTEIKNILSLLDGPKIKLHFDAHATVNSKSVSSTVTALTTDAFRHFGWDYNWIILKTPNGATEKFSYCKNFDGLQVAFEIGSRHRQQLLATYFKANLAVKVSGQPSRRTIGLFVIGAYLDETLAWGKWNGAVSSYQDYEAQSEVVDGVLAHPTIVFGLEKPSNLQIDTQMSGTLVLRVR